VWVGSLAVFEIARSELGLGRGVGAVLFEAISVVCAAYLV
jgi:hypothetical protein